MAFRRRNQLPTTSFDFGKFQAARDMVAPRVPKALYHRG